MIILDKNNDYSSIIIYSNSKSNNDNKNNKKCNDQKSLSAPVSGANGDPRSPPNRWHWTHGVARCSWRVAGRAAAIVVGGRGDK